MSANAEVISLGAVSIQKLEEKITALCDSIAENTIILADLLSQTKDLKVHRARGYGDWGEWVEKKFHIGERKARALVSMHRYFAGEDPSVLEKLKHVGWTKLYKLAGVVTIDNVDDWAERIQTMTLDQVTAAVRDLKKGKDPDQTGATDLASTTFRLYPPQAKVVEDALRLVSEMTGSDKRGYCLEVMSAMHQVAHQVEQEAAPGGRKIEAYLQQIADALKINIVGFHRDSHRVIAGRDLVPDIVDGLSEKGVGRLILKIAESGVLDKIQKKHRRALWEYLSHEFGSEA